MEDRANDGSTCLVTGVTLEVTVSDTELDVTDGAEVRSAVRVYVPEEVGVYVSVAWPFAPVVAVPISFPSELKFTETSDAGVPLAYVTVAVSEAVLPCVIDVGVTASEALALKSDAAT